MKRILALVLVSILVLSGTVAYAYIPDIDVTCSNGHDFTLVAPLLIL